VKRRLSIVPLLSSFMTTTGQTQEGAARGATPIVIMHVTVVSVDGRRPRLDQTIVIKDGRIEQIGAPAAQLAEVPQTESALQRRAKQNRTQLHTKRRSIP
jgi:hypothetical protein